MSDTIRIIIVGKQGIGKTRIARAIAAMLAAEECTIDGDEFEYEPGDASLPQEVSDGSEFEITTQHEV